jgi:tRNA-splicing ligase RtcB (3'-phosphate/5'-hydroxy nucleic acid ligase)
VLGSGNHFCEVQYVEHIYNEEAAKALGINQKGQVVTTIHCGSRGFGHQIAQDFITLAEAKQDEYGFAPVDRQLASLPLQSKDGQNYLAAMACAANFAWANVDAWCTSGILDCLWSQGTQQGPANGL